MAQGWAAGSLGRLQWALTLSGVMAAISSGIGGGLGVAITDELLRKPEDKLSGVMWDTGILKQSLFLTQYGLLLS